MKHIGFIGMGVMGSRMAARLIKAGFSVTVYNRTASKIEPLVQLGASRAETIREAVAGADIICTCLSMPEDVRQLYTGEQGIFEGAKPGAVCMDFTTVGRDLSVQLAEEANARQLAFLDTPMSGGPEGAAQGTLTIMVGGRAEAYEVCLPVLRQLGANVQYLGPAGMGSVAKLINQYLVAVHTLAATEALVTGSAYGIDPEQLYQILSTSYGDSKMLRRHMEQHVLERNFEPGGALKYLLKDIRLANQLVAGAGLEASTGQHVEAVLQRADEQHFGDKDMSAVLLSLELLTGVKVEKK
ncbi:NAD(P)-dependent oxidoreductase [Paenibacillus agricola]|uniref:NAD(P)-dependent oxidoreductase n=1 Tax=Paenibacillus agricola TaxID=2716264 RepID=A0ABX0J858_9BACL|nr:NAD(P)-dependent oxidoreductase [Paenibacillus agricola]NHN32153.1 NAD(P)-dependent oxidoreductase [Paenibacillus agricola]